MTIMVEWDGDDENDGTTEFFDTWEEAVEYMKKMGKDMYVIEVTE